MNKHIAIAVVGAGKWGVNLIRTFAQLGVLAAIVEKDTEKGYALAREYKVDYYQDIEDMLVRDIDAVAVATPVYSHYEIAKQVLLAKKDVFVEKPLATNAAQAQELVQLADESNLVLMVGHLLLYQPAITFIKETLLTGKIGQAFSLTQVRRSLGTIRKEENVLFSLGVHDLAVLDYLVQDEVDRIIVSSQCIISEQIADDMSVHLHYRSGVQAHLQLNWLWPYKERQLIILGEKGALLFNELQQEVSYCQNFGNKDGTVTQKGHDVIFSDQTPPLTLELQHFLECCEHRTIPRSCGRQGHQVIQQMCQIMQQERFSYEF